MNIDPNKVIIRLGNKIAEHEIQNAMLHEQVAALEAQVAELQSAQATDEP